MDTLNSMSTAVNLTPVVVAVISALVLALVALGIVMFVFCKSQNSLEEIRNNRRKRRGVVREAALFKPPTSNDFYLSAARAPTFPSLQQYQQPLYPTRPNTVGFNQRPQRQTPYYRPAVQTDRSTAVRPMRAYERSGNAAEEIAIPLRVMAGAYVPQSVPQSRSPFQNVERVYSATAIHHIMNTDPLPPSRQTAAAMFAPVRQP